MWKSYSDASKEIERKENNPKTCYEWAHYLEKQTQANYFNGFDFSVDCYESGNEIHVEFTFSFVQDFMSYQDCVNKLWNKLVSYAGRCPYRIVLTKKNFY